MLNEERISVMAKMASYEAGKGKEDIPVKQYYRKDYVSYQMIRTFLSSTISFGILFLFWIIYSIEPLMKQLADMDLIQFGVSVLIRYIIFVVIYQVIAIIIYNKKYSKATDSLKKYHMDIRKVMKLQEKEEKIKPSEEWE